MISAHKLHIVGFAIVSHLLPVLIILILQRLEMIMRRTRGGDSPTGNVTATTGDQSPANSTPVRGNSPTLVASDRVNSPVNKPTEIVNK